jgi:hypothetical protein
MQMMRRAAGSAAPGTSGRRSASSAAASSSSGAAASSSSRGVVAVAPAPAARCSYRGRRGTPAVVAAAAAGPNMLQKLGRVLREKAAGDIDRFVKGTSKTRERLGVGTVVSRPRFKVL